MAESFFVTVTLMQNSASEPFEKLQLPTNSGVPMKWSATSQLISQLKEGTLPLREWILNGIAKIAKSGPHRVVYRVTLNDRAVYIKQYLTGDRKSKLRTWLSGTKAARELSVLRAMQAANLPVPLPLGIGEPVTSRSRPVETSAENSTTTELNLPFLDDPQSSFLVLEAIEPTMSLANLMLRFSDVMQFDKLGIRGRQHLCVTVARMVARLHKNGFVHRDLQAENLLIAPVQSHGPMRMWWVDLSDIRQKWLKVSSQQIMLNLAMLRHSLHRHLSSTDQLRFLAAYLTELSNPQTTAAGEISDAHPADPAAVGDPVDFLIAARRKKLNELSLPNSLQISKPKLKSWIVQLKQVTQSYSIQAWKKADRKWRRGNRRLHIAQVGARSGRCVAGMDAQLLKHLTSKPSQLFSPPYLVQSTEGAALQKTAIIQLPVSGSVMQAELVARPLVRDAHDSWARRSWENAYALMRRGFSTPGPLLYVETESEQYLARAYHNKQKTIAVWISDQGRLSFLPQSDEVQVAHRVLETLARLFLYGFKPEITDLEQFFVIKLNGRVLIALADPSRFEQRESVTFKQMAASLRELHDATIVMTNLRTSTCARWLKRVACQLHPLTWRMLMSEIVKQRRDRIENYRKWHAA